MAEPRLYEINEQLHVRKTLHVRVVRTKRHGLSLRIVAEAYDEEIPVDIPACCAAELHAYLGRALGLLPQEDGRTPFASDAERADWEEAQGREPDEGGAGA